MLRGVFLVMFLLCSWMGTQAMEGNLGGDSFKPFRMVTGFRNIAPEETLLPPVEAFVQIIRQCYSPRADYSCVRVVSTDNSRETPYHDFYTWSKENTVLLVKVPFVTLIKDFYATIQDPLCTNASILSYIENQKLEFWFNTSPGLAQPFIKVRNDVEEIIFIFMKSRVVSLAQDTGI